MNGRRCPLTIILLLALGPASRDALAAETVRARGWLHANGYTHHFSAPDTNANLFGAGFSWYTWRSEHLATAWELDFFQDSDRKFSGYVGRSWSIPLGQCQLGATAALMYH